MDWFETVCVVAHLSNCSYFEVWSMTLAQVNGIMRAMPTLVPLLTGMPLAEDDRKKDDGGGIGEVLALVKGRNIVRSAHG